MRTFVESLRRLYVAGRITREKIASFLESGKITQEEFDYIVG